MTVRFGIVGCGVVANYHLAAIRTFKNAKIQAVCGKNPVRLHTFCDNNEVNAAESYESILTDKDVDCVCLCTPSGFHAEEALQAIAAGKHVIIEKPVCITVPDADRVMAAAMATDKTVSVISQNRFMDGVQEVKRAINRNLFGKIVSASLTMRYYRAQDYYDSGAWRGTKNMDGGGILMNQGIHGIDLFAYLVGPVKEVQGYSRTQLRNIEVEDTACAAVEFENGAIGVIDATVCNTNPSPMKIEICGENGTVILEDGNISFWGLDKPCALPVGNPGDSSSAASPTGISAENHIRQYADILNAIQEKHEPSVTVRDGRHALSIICGVYESSKSGKPVKIRY